MISCNHKVYKVWVEFFLLLRKFSLLKDWLFLDQKHMGKIWFVKNSEKHTYILGLLHISKPRCWYIMIPFCAKYRNKIHNNPFELLWFMPCGFYVMCHYQLYSNYCTLTTVCTILQIDNYGAIYNSLFSHPTRRKP